MKFLFLIFFIFIAEVRSDSVKRGELTPPSDAYDIEELNRVLFSELKTETRELRKVKYYLINGEIRLAKIYLANLAYKRTKLKPVINRYLAILSFMEGQYEKTYNYLNEPTLQNIPHYAKICTLKVLTEIILSKTRELENEWPRCQVENRADFNEQNLIWIDTLVQLKLQPIRGITKVPFRRLKLAALEVADAKMILKLALYLNQEALVEDQLFDLRADHFQDPELRELAGQIYFRRGALAKSYRFVEDLKSPNSENIKGNLYLLRQKYELAYAQFKLALEQKHDSQNALERLLPLAWLLGDWENGSKYAEQVLAGPQTLINKYTLMSVFLMQRGQYKEASRVLELIAQKSRRGTELEVTQIASFNALMQNKADDVRKQATMSCEQYDLVNCWLLFQMGQWDSFALTIRRDDKLPPRNDWEKLTKDDLNSPLKETVFVNQLDIEEMDDKLIQLIKTP